MMPCPNCGKFADFERRYARYVEPHGEDYDQEWFICSKCGATTDDDEIMAHYASLIDPALEAEYVE